jgi:DNA-binding response OmpR family regulator
MSSPVRRKQILIAEDNPTVAHLLMSQLESEGYETIHAADGTAAWRLLEQGEPPDLVLVDALVPGIGGPALCRRIRATPSLATLPVILLTALEDSSNRLAGLEAGATDFMGKPWSKAELYARVRSLLELKALQDTVQRQRQQLAVLHELGRESSPDLNADEIVAAMAARVAEAAGATGGSVVLVDARGPRRKLALDETLAPPVIVPPVLSEVEQWVAAQVFGSGEPILAADPAGRAGTEGVHSLLAAPLVRQQRMRGFVVLTHREPNHFDQESLDLLATVARQMAVAIENARLMERVQVERRRLAVLIYSMEDAVIATDPEQRVLLTNPAGAALFGEPDADLRGRPIRALADNEMLRSLFAIVASDGEPWGAEIEWCDGRQLYATVSPVGEDGEEGLVAVIQEIGSWSPPREGTAAGRDGAPPADDESEE